MNTQRIRTLLIAGLLWTVGLPVGVSRDVLELESRYRGDGWFDYRLRTLEDPFFKEIRFGQLQPDPFTNYIENTLPVYWTNTFYNAQWAGIRFDGTVPQPRINEISFSVRSSSTHFRRANYAFRTTISITFFDFYNGGGAGGYINLNCLIPCAPEQADGSPDVMVYRVELIPDLKIDQLISTNGNIHGLTFSWKEPSTVELQASHDLQTWTTVARFFGNPPQTTWTTNVALNSFGQFFRLSLVANSHVTSTQSSTMLAAKPQSSRQIPVENLQFTDDQIQMGFASVPNALYEVNYCEWPGRTIATKQVVATETHTTLSFDLQEPRNAAFFRVWQVSN